MMSLNDGWLSEISIIAIVSTLLFFCLSSKNLLDSSLLQQCLTKYFVLSKLPSGLTFIYMLIPSHKKLEEFYVFKYFL